MIQDIFPHVFHNEFHIKTPGIDSYFLYFKDGRLLLDHKDTKKIPQFANLKSQSKEAMSCSDYLFSIDQMDFFLIDETVVTLTETDSLIFYETSIIRDLKPMWVSFAAISAGQLHRFYGSNRFCGCCGSPMMKSKKERSMVCSSCGNTVYPKIAPAVIVAVTYNGKLLLTKYAGREYTRYALIAGYTEFGETLEETVNREVMEEVGLRVKNIRYYKNQPWGFSDSILVGYWAELDGSPQVHLDETELSTAVWMAPEDIPDDFTNLSLTHEMILLFKNGKVI
ncbi:NAD(+) diphosphatase [Clostridium sp. WB02_MRS01]|uniref:NAD(+) diphosphatase n=1 Tax=Clostridium sp. WB02_MRS01 TaxID=2605777 RepID=UPI0012B41BCD|nr:NAD(+) diphosphatase [Clostridium sp. WB02_MRS01]MSS11010.1 NAD(+) diphosphatase [Clostridium sp. WB02_MRS01]